jgi:class 3 adenylate cyclase
VATCSECGYEAAGSFRFCPECGARVDGRAREQRKVVTVLFCDVVGSTALGESVDAEALRATLARYFERMKSIVERHGGIVEKFIGDAVMAVFGLPAVHEDDAVRALRAAEEMQAALPELGIEGRIGVCSGEVVTGTEERLATGDTVNVAARLHRPRSAVRRCSARRPCAWPERRSRRSRSSLSRSRARVSRFPPGGSSR